jgi:hypothetical protein
MTMEEGRSAVYTSDGDESEGVRAGASRHADSQQVLLLRHHQGVIVL